MKYASLFPIHHIVCNGSSHAVMALSLGWSSRPMFIYSQYTRLSKYWSAILVLNLGQMKFWYYKAYFKCYVPKTLHVLFFPAYLYLPHVPPTKNYLDFQGLNFEGSNERLAALVLSYSCECSPKIQCRRVMWFLAVTNHFLVVL